LSKYRDRLQIIADILSIAEGRAKKTHIMYKANLSYKLLCRYLGGVMDAGLVVFYDRDCYVLTSKGKKFLRRYVEYSKHREHLKAHLNHVNDEKIILQQMCSNANTLVSDSNCTIKKQPSKRLT